MILIQCSAVINNTMFSYLRQAFRPPNILPSTNVFNNLGSALVNQVRHFAGRKGGAKRMKYNDFPHTPRQSGFGKKMEFFWPKGYRTQRMAVWENSRQHVLYDNSRKRWMTMWYRNGIQRFKTFSARHRVDKFEKSRQKAIILFHQLKMANKLGTPKPDVCNSGVRGVFMDRWEQAWVARWHDCGLQKLSVFKIGQLGFDQAYKSAVATRLKKTRETHRFVFQRFRWRGKSKMYGTART